MQQSQGAFPWPISNLPSLLPRETLYSWAGFVHGWNSNTDARITSQSLYGSPYAAVLHDFPSFLNTLDERVNHQLGSPGKLALENTLLGYFLVVRDAESAADIINSVCSGNRPHLKYELGIPASRVGGHHPLKGCSKCFDESEERFGRAYWRVDQQLPSALVCTAHQCCLQVAWDRVTPVHRRGWILPRMGLQRQWVSMPSFGPEQMSKLLKLATFSASWADLEPATLNPQILAKTYRSALKELGLATQSGTLRLEKLAAAVRGYYAGLDNIEGLDVLKSVHADWPGLAGVLSRASPRRGHPLKHLLLISMLFASWNEFLAVYRASTESPNCEAHTLESAEETPQSAMDRFKDLVVARNKSIRAAALEVGITPTTGVRWARVLAIPFTPRTKHLTPEKLQKVRRLLSEGVAKKAIIRRCKISAVSLARLLSSEPQIAHARRTALAERTREDNRKRFLDCIRSYPGWTVTQIRSLPGNGYAWLYRNDRCWLSEHLPLLGNSS